MLKGYFPDSDDATLALSFKALPPSIKKGGGLSAAAVKNQVDVLMAIGALTARLEICECVLWTNKFIK